MRLSRTNRSAGVPTRSKTRGCKGSQFLRRCFPEHIAAGGDTRAPAAKFIAAIFLLLAVLGVTTSAGAYDLIVRHGRVIDGAGNPAFFADVAIEKGRVVAVGKITNEAPEIIDATGLIVTPGFIDVH